MGRFLAASAAVLWSSLGAAQTSVSDRPETPFKLAAFELDGERRLALVLGETLLELEGANRELEARTGLPAMALPRSSMRELIADYDRLRPRLYQMANFFRDRSVEGAAFAHRVDAVRIEAPVKYPDNLIAAAANYRSHAAEMNVAQSVDPDRDAPYLFAKSPRGCIIDPNEPFVIPPGRDKIDWEGELAVVMGKEGYRLGLDEALDHVFGFTILYDVSDRGGAYRKNPMFPGPDWFSGKSRKGAAPMGPFVVPKEFLPNHDRLRLVTKVNDRVVQDASTGDMIYDVPHLVRYITSIMPLYPGDVIATGTPDGVGAGRKPPEFLEPGDVVSITIEGIGTLVTPIRAWEGATSDP